MAQTATTKVTTRITPWLSFVTQADPDYRRAVVSEPFYEFERRTFYGNNQTAGPYNPAQND